MKVDEVRHVSFTQLGITGTLTLDLIDADGKVTNKWEGALSENGHVSDALKKAGNNLRRNFRLVGTFPRNWNQLIAGAIGTIKLPQRQINGSSYTVVI